ncbi:MAG: hypothetical protein ACK6AD_03360 [Cyanobacteriota bacterium]
MPITLALLGIGSLGYGISIWLALLALRELGPIREAVLFSTASFVGALFAVVVLRDSLSAHLLLAAGLMAAGVALLLREQHSHLHRHEPLHDAHAHAHAHRHRHDPRAFQRNANPHHEHEHEHAHPHASDAHHRHQHGTPDGETGPSRLQSGALSPGPPAGFGHPPPQRRSPGP